MGLKKICHVLTSPPPLYFPCTFLSLQAYPASQICTRIMFCTTITQHLWGSKAVTTLVQSTRTVPEGECTTTIVGERHSQCCIPGCSEWHYCPHLQANSLSWGVSGKGIGLQCELHYRHGREPFNIQAGRGWPKWLQEDSGAETWMYVI